MTNATESATRDPELLAEAERQIAEAEERSAVAVTPAMREAAVGATYQQLEYQLGNRTPSAPKSSSESSPRVDHVEPGLLDVYHMTELEAARTFPQTMRLVFPDGRWNELTPEQRQTEHEASLAATGGDRYACEFCHDAGIRLELAANVPLGRRHRVDQRVIEDADGKPYTIAYCSHCPPATNRSRRLAGSLTAHELVRCTFDQFETETPAQRNALALVQRWARGDDVEHPILWLYGPAGTGKSHLAGAAARMLAEAGYPVQFVPVRRVLAELKATFDDETRSTEEVYGRYRWAGVLVLDDLGAERATDFAIDEIERLLVDRYAAREMTLITSNLSLGELAERQRDGHGRLVSRLADRSQSRLVELSGDDWRQRSPGVAS